MTAAGAFLVALALTIVLAYKVRDRLALARQWDAYLAAVREDAINEAQWARIRAVLSHPDFDRRNGTDTPIYAALAEETLAAELDDDDAISRWLA